MIPPFARTRFEKALFWGLIGLLLWLPIPLGSNRGWAWGVMEVAAFVLAGLWLTAWSLGKTRPGEALRKAWPAGVLLAAWVGFQALHVWPMSPSMVAAMSPEAAAMHALGAAVGARPEAFTLSIEAHASQVALLKTLAYAAIFFLVLALVNNRARLATFARVLVYAAVIHAVVAVLLHLTGFEGLYFGTRLEHATSASGSFPNRNHFAGYLEMALALGIGLLIAGLSDGRAETWKEFLRGTVEWILSPKMVLRLSLCILVIALTTTHSRMGNTAFFAGLLIAGVAGIALSRRATRNTVVLLVSLVVIDLAIVGSWFGVEKLATRIEQTTVSEVREREDPAAHAGRVLADYSTFGTGPGTFYIAFPRYRPESVAQFFDYAHNDYAQFSVESGWLGMGILGAFVLACLGAALAAQWKRRDPLMRGMSFASLMGVTALLIHSAADFNLQIPSNAAYFMVLLALGWIALFLDRREPA